MEHFSFQDFSLFAVPMSLFLAIGFLFDRLFSFTSDGGDGITKKKFESDFFDFLRRVYEIIFDKVFGEKFLSVRFFLISIFASIILFLIMSSLLVGIERTRLLFDGGGQLMVVIFCIFFNCLFDFISIGIARFVLHWVVISRNIIFLLNAAFYNVVIVVVVFAIAMSFFLIPVALAVSASISSSQLANDFVFNYLVEKEKLQGDDSLYRISTTTGSSISNFEGFPGSYVRFIHDGGVAFFDAVEPIDEHFAPERTSFEVRQGEALLLETKSLQEVRSFMYSFLDESQNTSLVVVAAGPLAPVSSRWFLFDSDYVVEAGLDALAMVDNIFRVESGLIIFTRELFGGARFGPYLGEDACYDPMLMRRSVLERFERLEDCNIFVRDVVGRANNDIAQTYTRMPQMDLQIPMGIMLATSLVLISLIYVCSIFAFTVRMLGMTFEYFNVNFGRVFFKSPFSISGLFLGSLLGLFFFVTSS